MGKDRYKLVANNKKAYHDYFIDETYEAGVALHGTEVKSVRMGKCSVKESFIRIEKEIFSIVIRYVRRNCCFINMRLTNWQEKLQKKATRWYH